MSSQNTSLSRRAYKKAKNKVLKIGKKKGDLQEEGKRRDGENYRQNVSHAAHSPLFFKREKVYTARQVKQPKFGR